MKNWCVFCRSAKAEFTHTFFDSTSMINADHWNKVTDSKNIYLTLDYLGALENAMKGTMKFRYVLIYNEAGQPVAAAAVQELTVSSKSIEYKDILSKAGIRVKHPIPGAPDIHVLICGNVFACGENGFAYTDEVSGEQAYEILAKGLKELGKKEKPGGAFSAVLLKDFWLSSAETTDILKIQKFRDFMIDVNMVLKLDKTWKTFNDYLDAMIAKFRTRAKGVYKKSEALRAADLGYKEIAEYKERIAELYGNVVEKAGFHFGSLKAEAFVNFKKNLGEGFIFKGYFLKDELIGFSSAFRSGNAIEANYVGIDYSCNNQYALYQRMLYDLVELGISRRSSELRLGRTAEEIKSCLGAEPVNMKLYIKHGNKISNKLLKPVIASIAPGKFEIRKPFRRITNSPSPEQKRPEIYIEQKELLYSEE